MQALYVDQNVGRARVGAAAPDFQLRTDGDELWRLADHSGSVTVLLFYPENETLVCTKQLCCVRDHWADYVATKATVIGVSPGTPKQHRRFSASRRLPIPLLADPGRVVTRMFTEHWLYPLSFARRSCYRCERGRPKPRYHASSFPAVGSEDYHGHLFRTRRCAP